MQSTCTSSSLRMRMERTLYLWRSSEEKVVVDLHLVFLAERMLYLYFGERYAAAKPPSGRLAHHSVGFYLNLGEYLDCS